MRNLTGNSMRLLRRSLPALGERDREAAERVLAVEGDILRRFSSLIDRRITAKRIRCHGDLHLGQVLFTGRDFMVIDFEGEPARSLSDRRVKRTPLRDVAGMLRSFHYATFTALLDQSARGLVEPDSPAAIELEAWGRHWYDAVSAAFLGEYLHAAEGQPWLPEDPEELALLLDTSLLEKAVYELGYELNNRPPWVPIVLTGLTDLVETAPG
jgi:maltose alpha-D-glucosyltransferase/alpha-amylase